MRLIHPAFCLFSLLVSAAAHSQIQFRHLDTDVAISIVRDIHRDREGFVWIANMGAGAMRYDGYDIRQYLRDEEDPASLSGNLVNCIFEDSTGQLWLGTTEGLNAYHPETDSFEIFRSVEGDEGTLQSSYVSKILEPDGELWVMTQTGLNLFDRTTKRFLSYSPEAIGDNWVQFSDCTYDGKGGFWIPDTGNYIWRFDIETRAWEHVKLWDKPRRFQKKIYRDSRGDYWIGTRGFGLYQFLDHEGRVLHLPSASDGSGPNANVLTGLLEYEEGTLLIAANQGGVNVLDLETRRFSYMSVEDGTGYGLTSNGALTLYSDYENILWVGSARSGVDFYNPNEGQFTTLRKDPDRTHISLAHNVVGSVFEDQDGRILIGTDGGGISIFDPKSRMIRTYKGDPTKDEVLPSDVIREIDQSSDGTFWIATWDAGVFAAHEKNGVFYLDQSRMEALGEHSFGVTWDLEIDSKDRLWVTAVGKRIYLLDTDLNLLLEHIEPNSGPMFTPPIVTETKSGDILVTGIYGVYRYNEVSNALEFFLEAPLPSCVVSAPNDGGYFVGTVDRGAYVFDPAGKLIRTIGKAEGLPSLMVRSLEVVGDNELWIATYNGLSRYLLREGKRLDFFESDGLQGNQYFVDASCKGSDGRLYFGGTNGLSYFRPGELKANSVLPRVRIDVISLFGDEVDFLSPDAPFSRHPNEIDRLELDWTQNFLSFSFTGVSMANPRQNRYAYMLEGLDEDWLYTDASNRVAVYTNIDPGKYVFRVRVSNGEGIWNEDEKRIQVVITPPFWQRTWFLLLCLLFASACLYFWILYRERRLRSEREKLSTLVMQKTRELNAHKKHLEDMVTDRTRELVVEKEKAEESNRLKSQFLANLSHEVRTPLNAVVGFTSLIRDTDPDVDTREEYLDIVGDNADQLIKLIEDILDISMISSGQLSMSVERFRLNELVNNIYQAHLLKFDAKPIELRLDNQVFQDDLTLNTDRFRVKQVIDNLLDNALKFTEKGFVEFGISRLGEFVRISVVDTGHGIPGDEVDLIFSEFVKLREDDKAARRGVGLGLAISKRLAGLMGGELSVESEYEKGSCFTFTLPLEGSEEKKLAKPQAQERSESRSLEYNSVKQVLVIEDEEANFRYLDAIFTPMGYETTWAQNGEQGVRLVEQNAYALVMLDIKMPGIDGYETLKRIRRIYPDLKVIAQTAYALKADRKKIEAAGFDGYLPKPIRREELIKMAGRSGN